MKLPTPVLPKPPPGVVGIKDAALPLVCSLSESKSDKSRSARRHARSLTSDEDDEVDEDEEEEFDIAALLGVVPCQRGSSNGPGKKDDPATATELAEAAEAPVNDDEEEEEEWWNAMRSSSAMHMSTYWWKFFTCSAPARNQICLIQWIRE